MESIQRNTGEDGEWVHGRHRVGRDQCQVYEVSSVHYRILSDPWYSCCIERDASFYNITVEERSGVHALQ